jgi:biopolymer transport protein ExbD
MAEKTRELDLWILQTNTVYRKVPYTVVTDWIQEGRLLAEDKVRPAGTEKWYELSKVPALAAFLPRAEEFRIEDRAEALEPVEVAFHWGKGKGEDEEQDVDMIPLIDISLVLLIFFMMTATVASGILSPINTPAAAHQLEVINKDMYWVGIGMERGGDGKVKTGADGKPVPQYSVGKADQQWLPPSDDLKPVLTRLQEDVQARLKRLKENPERAQQEDPELAAGEVRLRLRGDRDLMIEVIRETTVRLQGLEASLNAGAARKVKFKFFGEVSEPQ